MKRVNQKEIHKKTGDCMRASIATVLGIHLQAVPHITRTAQDKWFQVLYYFFIAYGYMYDGMWYPTRSKERLKKTLSINGYYLASVPSKTYSSGTHMVVVDSELNVVHDPHPNKKWKNESVKNEFGAKVYLFRKMNKTDLNYWAYL